MTNGAYLLNVDCDHYFNNSKALKEAMCFMMDPVLGKKTCYVQFPQRFDGIDLHDRYANRNIVFFDVSLIFCEDRRWKLFSFLELLSVALAESHLFFLLNRST